MFSDLSYQVKAVILTFMLLVVGAYIDTYPLYCRYTEMVLKTRDDQSALEQLQNRVKLADKPINKSRVQTTKNIQTISDNLQAINNIAHLAHVRLVAVKTSVHKSKKTDGGTAKEMYMFSGNSRDLFYFLYQLTMSAHFKLNTYSFSIAKEGVTLLEVNVAQSAGALSSTSTFAVKYNPMCNDGDSGMQVASNEMLQKPVASMQLMGFLQQGSTRIAWIKLSNGYVGSVRVGDVVGIERARVELIEMDKVILLLSDRSEYALSNTGLSLVMPNSYISTTDAIKTKQTRISKRAADG